MTHVDVRYVNGPLGCRLVFSTSAINCLDRLVSKIIMLTSTVFPLIEARSHRQAGSLIQAGGLTAFVPIQAGSPIESRGLTSNSRPTNTIEQIVAPYY